MKAVRPTRKSSGSWKCLSAKLQPPLERVWAASRAAYNYYE